MTVGTSYYVICPFDKNGVVANYYGVTDKGLKFSTFKIPRLFFLLNNIIKLINLF